ncbi:MAG: type II secretion system protein GspD [Methylococcaceae bacterium]|nr:MAG: type II secretion system protein GspD [Methylococcaceae bacterium]
MTGYADMIPPRRGIAAKKLFGWTGMALTLLSLTACELVGPQVDENPLVLPESQSINEASTQPLPAATHFESKNQLSAPEVYRASSGRVGRAPKPVAAPAEDGEFVLNFDDADLGEVAKVILGESLKKNFVLSPKVSGKVTLRTVQALKASELLPTLEMILRMNGAILVHDKGAYRIEPDADAARHGGWGQAGYRLQVVPLKYVSAQEMQTVLQPILPANAILKMDTARNLLFLAGSGEDIERVIEVVQVFDVNYLQGMSFGIYPLKNVAVNTIFAEMQAMFGEGAGGPLAGTIRLLPIERLNAVMAITAQPAYLEELRTWVDRLDRSNSSGGGNMHVYRAQHVDAVQLAATLSQVLGGGGSSGYSQGGGLAPGLTSTTLSGAAGGSGLTGGLGGSGTGSSGLSGGLNSSSAAGSSGSSGLSSSANRSSSSGGSGSSLLGSGAGGLGSTGSSMGMSGAGTSGSGFGGGTGGYSGFGGGSAGLGGMSSSGGSTAGGVRVTPDPSNNAVVIVAPPFEYQAIEKLLRELDVMPLQVLVDAMIVEIKLDDTLKYGLQWLFKHGNAQQFALDTSKGDILTAAAAAASGGFAYSFLTKNIEVTLDALASAKKLNVLSSPSLMVLNNQQATIKVGDQVPIRTSETTNTSSLTQQAANGTASALVTGQIQMRDTGVQLVLRPRVNKGGLVIMDIQQQVDDVSETTSSKIDSPTITQRQIQSSVAVKSGDTVVLGGLIKESRVKGNDGLPWLSNLPYIGALFGTVNRELRRTELVVLITPHVVEDRNTQLSVTEEYKARLKGLQARPEDAGILR